MAFYENTIVAKQDLAENELKTLKEKYNDIINNSSGKLMKSRGMGSSRICISRLKDLKKVFLFIINLREIKNFK